jgi:hypothetical protein
MSLYLNVAADLPPMLSRLGALCDSAGVTFSPGALRRKWAYPSAAGAMALCVFVRVAALALHRAQNLLQFVSMGLAIIGMAGFLTLALTVRKIARTLDHLERGDSRSPRPPSSAKFLLLLLIPRHNREHLVGDLEEEFATVVLPEYGERRARFWYWWKVITSIAPLAWAALRRILTIALLWRHGR